MTTQSSIELQRIRLQSELDEKKTPLERNRLGQFATPHPLANDILQYASRLLPKNAEVRFLDPAIGTGAFYAALIHTFGEHKIAEARGFEIDPHYAIPAEKLWRSSNINIKIADFTKEKPDARFNLVICNPPYVRHHHLGQAEKKRLRLQFDKATGLEISGLAGLYCYFIGLSHAWMSDDGIAGWLIPSEFMDVNYGEIIKKYLLHNVTLLHIHRFDPNDVQFADALVSSAIVWFKNAPPPKNHTVKFTFGGTLIAPMLSRDITARDLVRESKWTRFPMSNSGHRLKEVVLSDFFDIKRGIATGDNKFFILDRKEIAARNLPLDIFQPILPSPRYLPNNEITSDINGIPLIEHRLFVLDVRLPENEIKVRFPSLYKYLASGKQKGIHKRYLCQHRKWWYLQENRLPPPIVCTYLGRGDTKTGRPFRFIINHSVATVSNGYLAMYPKSNLLKLMEQDTSLINRICNRLNTICPEQLLSEGRVYGGGLHKLEPRELANLDATIIADILSASQTSRDFSYSNIHNAVV